MNQYSCLPIWWKKIEICSVEDGLFYKVSHINFTLPLKLWLSFLAAFNVSYFQLYAYSLPKYKSKCEDKIERAFRSIILHGNKNRHILSILTSQRVLLTWFTSQNNLFHTTNIFFHHKQKKQEKKGKKREVHNKGVHQQVADAKSTPC